MIGGEGLWPTLVDPNQLENAILNLAINGRDAMPGGGRVTVETAEVESCEGTTRTQPGVPPGPCVMLAIAAAGFAILCGIAPSPARR